MPQVNIKRLRRLNLSFTRSCLTVFFWKDAGPALVARVSDHGQWVDQVRSSCRARDEAGGRLTGATTVLARQRLGRGAHVLGAHQRDRATPEAAARHARAEHPSHRADLS